MTALFVLKPFKSKLLTIKYVLDFRAWVYAVTWMIWVGGMAILPLIAWLCGNWFYIGLVTSIPGFLLFLYIPYLPES